MDCLKDTDNIEKPYYYLVKSPYNSYYVQIFIKYFNNKICQITLLLDTCVTIIYETLNDYMYLESVFYKEECNSEGNLEKKTGTRDMIHSALAFMYIYCSKLGFIIKKILLSDKSYNQQNRKVSLFNVYMSLHGLTWYENYFNATLDTTDKKLQEKYSRCIMKMAKKEFKSNYTIHDLEDSMNFKLPSCIYKIYNESTTFIDFFNNILNVSCQSDYNCYVDIIFSWIKPFIKYIIFEGDYRLTEDGQQFYKIMPNDLLYKNSIEFRKIDKIPDINKRPNLSGGGNKKLIYHFSKWYDLGNKNCILMVE